QAFPEFSDVDTKGDFMGWPTAGFEDSFIGHGAPHLYNRGAFPDDASAYRAVLADPTKVIVPRFFLVRERAGPPKAPPAIGTAITMRDPETQQIRQLTIAAIAESGFENPIAFMGKPSIESVFAN